MEFYTYTLSNGIRCILKRVHSAVTHCAMTINTGTRDELQGEFGMAHLVEHTIFKGTEKRKAYHINCRLENLGGELNAYTSKEETVVHATTLKSDYGKAVELISDILFHSTFQHDEVEREKEVIYDEINMYKDSPADKIFDDFEDLIFAGSSLGHNILGSKNSLNRLHSEQIKSFMRRTYNTDQMVFSTIGNVSERTFAKTMNRYFGDIPANSRNFERIKPDDVAQFSKTVGHSTHQMHCAIGHRAYSLDDSNRLPLLLLTNVLGGPSANSLLNLSLREKNALSYNIEASYTPMLDSGIFTIYFSSEKDKYDKCLELVYKQLDDIKKNALSSRRLSIAKKQFIGQFAISMESNEGYMLGAAKSYLVYNYVDSVDVIYKQIGDIGCNEIMNVANEIFDGMSILTYK